MIAFMYITLLVSLFLLDSDRFQEAIEIWKECLILLNNTDQQRPIYFTTATNLQGHL